MKLAHILMSKSEMYKACSFHLPHSYNLQILLARGNGASTNVEPCWYQSLLILTGITLGFPEMRSALVTCLV